MSLIEEAQAFHAQHPTLSVSAFACCYPGQYREAAQALRQVRRVDDETDQAITDSYTDRQRD